MFSLAQEFHRRLASPLERPRVYFTLINAFGLRVFSDGLPSEEGVGLLTPVLADGVFLADGVRRAGEGSMNLLERGARVLSFGRIRESLTAAESGLWASLKQQEPAGISVTLSNAGPRGGRPFSLIQARENLLGARGEVRVGFKDLPARDHLVRFAGRVTAYGFTTDQLTLTLKA